MDQQIQKADPFEFGKLLKKKQPNNKDLSQCGSTPTRDLSSLCPTNCYYDQTTAVLEEEINNLKAIKSPQDFQKRIDELKKVVLCLKKMQISYTNKLDTLSKKLSLITRNVSANALTADPKGNISTENIAATFKALATEIELMPRIKNSSGKAQNYLEYYDKAIKILSNFNTVEQIEAIQYLLKEANDSALDGPIYKNKQTVIQMLQAATKL